MTAFFHLLDDVTRKARAQLDGGLMRAPIETTGCPHGRPYSFRHVWQPDLGPENGTVLFLANDCPDCERHSWLQPGSSKRL